MLKKSFTAVLILFLVLIFTPQSQAHAASFSDVTQNKSEIEYLVDRGVITGYTDGTFKPKRDITRLQAITMILREKGITDFEAPNPSFTDIKPGDYGYEIVAKAVDLGFISGKENKDGSKYFDSAASVTRGQMSKILVEAYQLPKTKDVKFSDVSSTNGFKDYISTLSTKRITTGYEDGSFKPSNNLSRQHFAVFMSRALNQWNGSFRNSYFSGNHSGLDLKIADSKDDSFHFQLIEWSESWVENAGHWGTPEYSVLVEGVAHAKGSSATFSKDRCDISFKDTPSGIEMYVSENCSKDVDEYGGITDEDLLYTWLGY